jgi:hypothetical protein
MSNVVAFRMGGPKAFSSEAAGGSRQENASEQKHGDVRRFGETVNVSKSEAAEPRPHASVEGACRGTLQPALELMEKLIALHETAIWRLTDAIALLEKRHSRIRADLALIGSPAVKAGLEAQLHGLEQQLAATKRQVNELSVPAGAFLSSGTTATEGCTITPSVRRLPPLRRRE